MKVLIRSSMDDKNVKRLEQLFGEAVFLPWNVTGERYDEDQMIALLNEHKPEILVEELDTVSAKVIENAPFLKVIGDCRAMPANIDIPACTKAKIPVLCTPARNAESVAELLVCMLIAFYRNLIPAVNWVNAGNWVEGSDPFYKWMGHEIYGKKIGLVGFGAVARHVAKILKGFECDMYFYDPYVPEQEGLHKVEMEYIFKNCEVVSIHLPVLDSTRGLVNRDLLSLMGPETVFINTARSAVMDMNALYDLLRAKKIKGAILDVLDKEPPTANEIKIKDCPNVLLAPHICGASHEVTNHHSDIVYERLALWKDGKDLEKIVYNKDVLK